MAAGIGACVAAEVFHESWHQWLRPHRALWGRPAIELVHVNDRDGDAAAAAHLLPFDSVHGRWSHEVVGADGAFRMVWRAYHLLPGG